MSDNNSNKTDGPPSDDKFVERMMRYLCGQLSADEVLQLSAQLRADPAARDLFVRLCLLESRLVEKFAPGRREFLADSVLDGLGELTDTKASDAFAMPAIAPDDLPDEIEHNVVSSPVWAPRKEPAAIWRRPPWVAAAALLLGVAIWSIVWWGMRPAPALPVASVMGTVDLEWDSATSGLATGGTLAANTEFRIRGGLLRLRFNSGADVVIEGPAVFTPNDNGDLTLSRGRLTAVVPPAAKGFKVRTASAVVTDLGTEFGVDAGAGSESPVEVHVFEGLISLLPVSMDTTASPQNVSAGAAARVDKRGVTTNVVADPTAFVRIAEADARQRAANGLGYDRWLSQRFAMARDADVVAYYPLDDSNERDAPDRLLNRSAAGRSLDGRLAGDGATKPRWTAGRWPQKKALAFDGVGSPRIELPIAGGNFASPQVAAEANKTPFTIALWIKAAPRPSPGASIVSWTNAGFEQFSLATESTFYRTVARDSQVPGNAPVVINSQNFVSTKWHHVAAVYDAGSGVLTLYVDGEKVTKEPAAVLVGELRLGTGPAIVGCRPNAAGEYEMPLYGAIDELVFWKRAITPFEIQQMFKSGRPE